LDKRLGLAQVELITPVANRDFSSDTGFWTKEEGTITIGGGSCNFAATSFNFGLSKPLLLTSGKYYVVTFTVTSLSAGSFGIYLGGNQGTARNALGTYTERIQCGVGNQTLTFLSKTAGTTGSIDNVSCQEITGNHVLQATGGSRPEYDVISGISSDFTDGTDDSYATSSFVAGTLTNNMDVFLALKRTSAAGVSIYNTPGVAPYLFYFQNGIGALTNNSVGAAWTTYANGVQFGGTGTTTAGDLFTAIPSATWKVLEARNVDLSAWTALAFNGYTTVLSSADIGGVIICPAQSTAMRNSLRTWLGAKVGLTL
jgi:hypothetical protein